MKLTIIKPILLILIMSLFQLTCDVFRYVDDCGVEDGDNRSCKTYGCFNPDACNYIGYAIDECENDICIDDDSCYEAIGENFNCEGDCLTNFDCNGNCAELNNDSFFCGDTIKVPENASTIQSALDVSVSGNIILVSQGTYDEALIINQKVLLTSRYLYSQNSQEIENTVISDGLSIKIDGVEINGFTIQNDESIAVDNAGYHKTVVENSIIQNSSIGIDSNNVGDIVIRNSIIQNCSLAGVSLFNSGTYYGNSDYHIVIDQCIISNNEKGINIYSTGSRHGDIFIIDSKISNNSKGLYDSYSYSSTTIDIQRTIISECQYGISGGILSLNLENTLISDNDYGIHSGSGTLNNVTIYNNEYSSLTSTTLTVNNSIIDDFIPSTSPVSYSNIIGGWGETNNINGNISIAPLFIDPENGDYNLMSTSPCLDTGNPDSDYNDVDGSRNDMGAFGGVNGDWTPIP